MRLNGFNSQVGTLLGELQASFGLGFVGTTPIPPPAPPIPAKVGGTGPGSAPHSFSSPLIHGLFADVEGLVEPKPAVEVVITTSPSILSIDSDEVEEASVLPTGQATTHRGPEVTASGIGAAKAQLGTPAASGEVHRPPSVSAQGSTASKINPSSPSASGAVRQPPSPISTVPSSSAPTAMPGKPVVGSKAKTGPTIIHIVRKKQ